MSDQLKDGVYLGLPEETYFAQRRQGSTDWAKLFLHREGWWWSSRFNPHRVDTSTRAKDFGSGLHANVLEGEKVFYERYCAAPEKNDFPDLCVTADDIREALEGAGYQPNKSASKVQLRAMIAEMMPEVPVWDAICEKAEADAGGRTVLAAPDFRSIEIMAAAVREHPEIGPLFQFSPEHIPLPEVTVLYTDEHGIQCRDRLDLMLPTVSVDLKTIAGSFAGKELKFAVPEQIVRYGYLAQLASHHRARQFAYRFIRDGNVHGGTEYERAWLARFPNDAPAWDYCWLFYSKPDAKEGRPPVLFPLWEDYAGEWHRQGLRALHEATETYRRCLATFGPDKPWTRAEPLHVSTEGVPDRVYWPHWAPQISPLPNEEELLNG